MEPVLALVGRADLLSTLLLLLASLLLLLPGVHLLQLIGASIIAATALLAKETAIVSFVFLIAIVLLKTAIRQPRSAEGQMKNVLASCIYLLSAGLLLAVWRHWMGGWAAPRFARGDNPGAAASYLLTRLLTFNHIYGLNLLLLLCPVWLCFDWALGCVPLITSLADFRIAGILLLWTASLLLTSSVVKSAMNNNYLSLSAVLLLILPFLLSMNLLVHVGFVIAERSLYLSTAGAALLVNIGRRRLAVRCGRGRLIIHMLYAVALVALLGRTVLRSRVWRSQNALFESGLSVCPENAKVHYNLARVLAKEEKKEEEDQVLLLYKEALRLGKGF